jgi:hypothetical protein
MKICQISTVHPLNDNRIFHKECITLFNAGYNVTLIIQNGKKEKLSGIQVIPLKKRRCRLSRMLFGSFEAFSLAINQCADIYHFHDPELIPVGLALKLLRKKVIYDVHENTSKQILTKSYLKYRLLGYCSLP